MAVVAGSMVGLGDWGVPAILALSSFHHSLQSPTDFQRERLQLRVVAMPLTGRGIHRRDGRARVRNRNSSRMLVDVQPLNQFGRLNIHRQQRNDINPTNTARPFWEQMDTVGVGFEKTRGKRWYPALPDLPCTPFLFTFSKRITLAASRLKVDSRNSCINVPSFVFIHFGIYHPIVAGFAIVVVARSA